MTVLLNNHPQDFIEAMNWETSHVLQKSIQHSIPFGKKAFLRILVFHRCTP